MKKKPPPEPKPPPYFEPLPIYNKNTYGTSKLPPYVNPGDPYDIFKLLLTDKLLDMLMEYINRNAELHPTPEEKIPKGSPRP